MIGSYSKSFLQFYPKFDFLLIQDYLKMELNLNHPGHSESIVKHNFGLEIFLQQWISEPVFYSDYEPVHEISNNMAF